MVTVEGPSVTAGVILSVSFVLIGLWLAIWPEPAWRLRNLLSFRDPASVEPSTFVLVYYRVSGVIGVVLGAVMLWAALFRGP